MKIKLYIEDIQECFIFVRGINLGRSYPEGAGFLQLMKMFLTHKTNSFINYAAAADDRNDAASNLMPGPIVELI